jgi:hypothetical protein
MQTLSFEDPHAPMLAKWSLHEVTPTNVTRNNSFFRLGGLPVPSAPEPSTLALALFGAGGFGLGAFRRWRQRGRTQS